MNVVSIEHRDMGCLDLGALTAQTSQVSSQSPKSITQAQVRSGCGSILNRRGYASFGPCFHLQGTGFLSHSQVSASRTILLEHLFRLAREIRWSHENGVRVSQAPAKTDSHSEIVFLLDRQAHCLSGTRQSKGWAATNRRPMSCRVVFF